MKNLSKYPLDYFDGILYINLDHRKDRRLKIEKQLKSLGIRVFRIEGVYDELNGTRGCVLSHLKAIDFALDKQWNNVLILEDDCLFTSSKKTLDAYIHNFFELFQDNWDVFFLGTQVIHSEPAPSANYQRILCSLRAHAYAVNRPYLPTLKENYLATHASMQNDLFFTHSLEKALDRAWIPLQMQDRWFAGTKMVAQQMKSYSDIEKGIKNQR